MFPTLYAKTVPNSIIGGGIEPVSALIATDEVFLNAAFKGSALVVLIDIDHITAARTFTMHHASIAFQ